MVPLLLSGCTGGGSGDFGAERSVVADFFEVLESGDSSGVAALLTDDSALSSAVLDSDFYAAAVETPTDARVTAASEFEPGVVYVTVEYSLGGEDRDIKVEVVESDGKPRIDGWLHETLSIDPLRAPGAWQVNGSVQTGELEEETQFVALPGTYEFEYVDEQGLGTVDPDGAATTPFEVEFPVEGDQLASSVPPGITARGSGIGAEPRLLATAQTEVDAQLADLVAACSTSALLGDSCPADVVSQAGALGAVDASTVVWTEVSDQNVVPGAAWDLAADYTVAFSYVDAAGRTGRTSIDATVQGVVTADALGKPVLEPAG